METVVCDYVEPLSVSLTLAVGLPGRCGKTIDYYGLEVIHVHDGARLQ